jgi:hypothetical protein
MDLTMTSRFDRHKDAELTFQSTPFILNNFNWEGRAHGSF